MLHDITYAKSILDKFFCNHPLEYGVSVFTSCLKTKHKTILATGYQVPCKMQPSSRKKSVVFDLRACNIDTLRYCLNNCSWNNVYDGTDINEKFQNFIETLLILMSRCIPARVVRLGRKDLSFVSPLVRMLLNKRRILRRRESC